MPSLSSAGVLVLVVVLILVILVVVLVAVLTLVLILILLVHCKFLRMNCLRFFRRFSIPTLSGFILRPEENADNKACDNGGGDSCSS